MAEFVFTADGVDLPLLDETLMKRWIEEVARGFGKSVGDICYIFCSDEKILEVNREFLNHDYYTDIITFDYGKPHRISGDMFISLDTVLSNSEMVGDAYQRELYRVIIHGILHLCGVNDKGEGEREIMERFENQSLDLLSQLQNN